MRMIVLLFSMSLFASSLSSAHGLLLKLESQDNRIYGTAYFTNGETAGSQEVEMIALNAPAAKPLTAITNAEGQFQFPATNAQRYRVSVFGEEGHEIHMEITAGEHNKGAMIEENTDGETSSFELPAWAVIGGLLLLSVIPALWRRKK